MRTRSFRFRLERVRDLREHKEHIAKQELAAAMVIHHCCETELLAAEQRIAEARAAQLDAARLRTSASDLIARQAYLERTEQIHLATRLNLDRRERELADRRAALSRAARDRQALERLKERRRVEHQHELDRAEGLELDDVATNYFRRSAA